MPYCIRLAVSLFAAIELLAAPVTAQTAAPVKRPAASHRTVGTPQKSDAHIEAAIRARLAQSKISSDHFQVHVQGGVATIEGSTGVLQHKGTATRLAKSAGAVAVVNRVQISDAARQRAAANLAKGRRRAQIKRGDPRSLALRNP
ncbi:MAG: BON domain-containing protein [Bryobacteraceae bacterium]|jgi:osmotically-inducible protein OsmY